MSFSYITFHVPFTAKPAIPQHLEYCGIILSASEKFHPDKSLNNRRILAVTIYNESQSFSLSKAAFILKEFILFLNLSWNNKWSLNYVLNIPFMDFEPGIKQVSNVEKIFNGLDSSPLMDGDYSTNFDSFKYASTEFSVLEINVKEDFEKFLTVTASEDLNHQRLKEQMEVFVIGEGSDKFLLPLYENINLKYSLLNSVFEDIFLRELNLDVDEIKCMECGRPIANKTYYKKLKHFLSTLPADKLKRDLYYKMFKDIYKHRNLFTHELKKETKIQQIQTLTENLPKFGYTLSDHIKGKVARLGGEDIFITIIRKHLIEELKKIKPLSN